MAKWLTNQEKTTNYSVSSLILHEYLPGRVNLNISIIK